MSYFDCDPEMYLDDSEMYGSSPRMMYRDPNFIDDDGYGKDGAYYGIPEEEEEEIYFCDICGEMLDEYSCIKDLDTGECYCENCYEKEIA